MTDKTAMKFLCFSCYHSGCDQYGDLLCRAERPIKYKVGTPPKVVECTEYIFEPGTDGWCG